MSISFEYKRRRGKMKKVILAVAMVVIMVAMLAAPAFASGGAKVWYLQNSTMSINGSSMNYMQTTQAKSGTVNISTGSSLVWVTNDYAHGNITFPNDYWVLRVMTDSDWGTNGSGMTAELGYWDGSFHRIGYFFSALWMTGGYQYNNGILEWKYTLPAGDVIPDQKYLAVKITNNDTTKQSHAVYCGYDTKTTDGVFYSCLTTPQSDPGYPLPEVAAGVLLGGGLLAIGGFVLIRRKHITVKSQ
jgi:hypothetical protein